VKALKQKNVEVRIGDISVDSIESLVSLVSDIHTVISAVPAQSQLVQTRLADAAKKAGAKRFIPCGFTTCAPPGGITLLRDHVGEVTQCNDTVLLTPQ
jgi:hypothetical protein